MSRVRQVIGQLHQVVETLVARGDVVALDGVNRSVVQVIIGRLLYPASFEILVAEAVV